MTEPILFAETTYKVERVPGEPGCIFINMHTSVKHTDILDFEIIGPFTKTLHKLPADEIRAWPDAEFAPIKAELQKLLATFESGHFKKGVWIPDVPQEMKV